MTRFADLHIHTHYSDSTASPQEGIQEAIKAGLQGIAITDHDTMEGVLPAQHAAQGFDLEIIPGIELSSEWENKDIHILGYFLDGDNEAFRVQLDKIQESRIERIKKMIEKLKSLGVHNVHFEEVFSLTESKSVGRPHLAKILLDKGWVGSIREAFDRYIGEEGPAYVTKYKLTPYEAIQLIRKAGGIAVMAHPMFTQKDELLPGFITAGMQGIEVYYPSCSKTTIAFYEGLAQKYHLIPTGGSDFHGKLKPDTYLGKKKVSYEIVERLKKLKELNSKSV